MIASICVRHLGGAHRSTPSMKRSAHGPLCVAGVVARASGGHWLSRSGAGEPPPAPDRVEEELPQSFFSGDDDSLFDLEGGLQQGTSAGGQPEDLQRAGAGGRNPGAGRWFGGTTGQPPPEVW